MSETITSNKEHTIAVNKKDLPVCCPPRDSEAIGLHPRVYLKFDKQGKAKCPYCGMSFVVK